MMVQLKQSSWTNRPKIIREELTTFVFLSFTILLVYFALQTILTPWMVIGTLILYITILLFTYFNEQTPSPWWHFNKSIEGTMLLAIPLLSLFYFFTLFSENFTVSAQLRAQIAVVYCSYMMVYVVLSGIPFLGIVFTVLMAFWSGIFLNYLQLYDYPMIISPGIILCILMGLGLWFTNTTFVWVNLRRLETFGNATLLYRKVAKIIVIIKFIIGIVILIYNASIQALLLSFLSS